MPHAVPPLTDEDKAEAIHVLFDLYRKVGDADYIGEAISQTEHACQAGMLAELEDASPEGERQNNALGNSVHRNNGPGHPRRDGEVYRSAIDGI